MKKGWVFYGSTLAVILLVAGVVNGFSQTQGTQSRIPQQILIKGQTVNGAFVVAANGGMQAYTCPNPEQYTTPDGASQGWACFEQSTNTWLLNALPPAQPQTQTQPPVQTQPQPPAQPQQQAGGAPLPQAPPAVVYQQPAPTVIYTNPYPPYPYVVAPAYGPSFFFGAAFGPRFYGPRFYAGPVFYGRFWHR